MNLAVDESRSVDDPTILRDESYGQSSVVIKTKPKNETGSKSRLVNNGSCTMDAAVRPVVSVLDVSLFEKRAKKL